MSDCGCELEIESRAQARVLWILLAINGAMFLAELVAGLLAESTALIADSFDMLADAAVYGASLFAVFRGAFAKASAARFSGYLQVVLGAVVLAEVARRVLFGSNPEAPLMILVSAFALVANVICLRLIATHREGGVHMRASYIFSQNDVIANSAAILGGFLVAASGWAGWDLIVGAGIGCLVFLGGARILTEARLAASRARGASSADHPMR